MTKAPAKKVAKKKAAKKLTVKTDVSTLQSLLGSLKKLEEQVAAIRNPPDVESAESLDDTPSEDATLLQRILWVRKRVTKLGKDSFVQTGRNANVGYKAVTHDKVTAFIRPKMNQAGIVTLMTCVDFTTVETGAATEKGRKIVQFQGTYRVRFINAFDVEDFIELSVPSFADDFGDKAPGKAASYAMKYALLKQFMIETGEDDEERVGPTGAEDGGRVPIIDDDEKAKADIFALADELYGDDAAKKLKACAKRRFMVDSYVLIPLDRKNDVTRALQSNWKREQAEKGDKK